MIAFIKKHEGWFDFVVFGSSSALLFIYTPLPLIQSLAQSPFFYFLGPAAGPGANLMLSSIGGAAALLSIKGLGLCLNQIHEIHHALPIHPEETNPVIGESAQAQRLFFENLSEIEQTDRSESFSESQHGLSN